MENNPFDNEDKTFDTVDEYLNRLQEDLSDKGHEIEWGETVEENGKESVEIIYEGNVLDELRVPTNLDVINKQVGPLTGYDMMLDAVESALYYDQEGGDLPFLNQN